MLQKDVSIAEIMLFQAGLINTLKMEITDKTVIG